VLDRLGLPAEAVAYVDDIPEYVAAATALGIRAIMALLDEPRWQPLGETPVLGGYWQVTEGRFRLPGGSEITRRLIHNRHPAMVLCLNDQRQVLLIRQYRAPFNEVMWELPGGDRDEGESIEEAAARECEEETGYRPLAVKHVLTSRASPGESDAEFYICIAQGVTPGRLTLGTDEQIRHYWVDLSTALDLARQGFIRHPGAARPALCGGTARRLTAGRRLLLRYASRGGTSRIDTRAATESRTTSLNTPVRPGTKVWWYITCLSRSARFVCRVGRPLSPAACAQLLRIFTQGHIVQSLQGVAAPIIDVARMTMNL